MLEAVMSVCSSLITSSIERLPIRTILAVLGQKVLELERRSLMAPMTRPFYFFRPTYLARGSQTIEWVFLMGKTYFLASRITLLENSALGQIAAPSAPRFFSTLRVEHTGK